jgi:hypothetical protein
MHGSSMIQTKKEPKAIIIEKQNSSTQLIYLMMSALDETCTTSYNKEKREVACIQQK